MDLGGFVVTLIASLLVIGVVGVVASMVATQARKEAIKNDWDVRSALRAYATREFGEGLTEFDEDFGRVIHLPADRSCIGLVWWDRGAVRGMKCVRGSVVSVKVEENPLVRLRNLNAPTASMTSLVMALPDGDRVGIRFSDEAKAQTWLGHARSVLN